MHEYVGQWFLLIFLFRVVLAGRHRHIGTLLCLAFALVRLGLQFLVDHVVQCFAPLAGPNIRQLFFQGFVTWMGDRAPSLYE